MTLNEAYELGTGIVNSEPDVFFTAIKECVVQLWVSDRRLGGGPNGVVRISKRLDDPEYWAGAILPFNTPIKVHLDPGEFLVAKTQDEADLSFSAVPV